MSKNKSIRLSLLSNCFDNDNKYHLGFKYKGVTYCISHSKSSSKFCVLIPKDKLKKKFMSKNNEYLKITKNIVTIINRTNMFIDKSFIENVLNE